MSFKRLVAESNALLYNEQAVSFTVEIDGETKEVRAFYDGQGFVIGWPTPIVGTLKPTESGWIQTHGRTFPDHWIAIIGRKLENVTK